eukprot:CAMPEP_0181185648 /NCGR_PEP_ID=MMETSP1096-20121128/9618_1 /TAXON_ID=156174 ORGANISM="Chrysochromulina ericina, Strain CCMP281" /NCGR_SAMPLE_ID=MMETSP1096 /ASSEMBLY_ACC=CAM_ASM_000453 /LENGTH=63 /DNA_ID=CAMNT_0023274503 /DNA_START=184 /DNA_END=375 /DNA_ORIENTATION=-
MSSKAEEHFLVQISIPELVVHLFHHATGLSREDEPQHVALSPKARLKLEEHKLRGAHVSSGAH